MSPRMLEMERAARLAMGDSREEENAPLPPAPNYGPFGYFRLAVLGFAAIIAIVLVLAWI
jgi:hypothetical protein